MRTIQEILGLSDVSTTMVYAHVLNRADAESGARGSALRPVDPSC